MNVIIDELVEQVCEKLVDKNLINNNVKEFTKLTFRMIALYAIKNHDYGNSFDSGIDVIGPGYATGRLYDKLSRIINLTKVTAEVDDESIDNTLIDLANYSIMYLKHLENE